jgi:LysM repeat protein
MKPCRALLWGLVGGLFWGITGLQAQESTNSTATLIKKENDEERYRSLEAELKALQSSYEAQQKRLVSLAEALQQMREELDKKPVNVVTRDDLKPFEEKLQELNKNREADKKLILEQLDKLAKAPPVVAPPPAPESEPAPAAKIPNKGYEYVVKPGDRLSNIVEAYRNAGVKVTVSLVQKANPKLKPERLIPGEKIFIPDPAQK